MPPVPLKSFRFIFRADSNPRQVTDSHGSGRESQGLESEAQNTTGCLLDREIEGTCEGILVGHETAGISRA